MNERLAPLLLLGGLGFLAYYLLNRQQSAYGTSAIALPQNLDFAPSLPFTPSPDGYSTATGQPVTITYGASDAMQSMGVPVPDILFDWNALAQSIPLTEVSLSSPVAPTMYSPSVLTTSPQGRANIQAFEGWQRTAYADSAGHLTIGVGHKIVPGDGMGAQTILTDGQVLNLFNTDLQEAESYVKSVVTAPVTQGMFDALVDFVFNLGIGNLMHSTLLSLLNARDYQGAANEFGKWINAGGQPNAGLIARRQSDTQTFLS